MQDTKNIIAKSVLSNKYWILESNGKKVGTIQAIEAGGFSLVANQERKKYASINSLSAEHNIFFDSKKTKKSSRNPNLIDDYPISGKAYNVIWNVKKKFAAYTKTKNSKTIRDKCLNKYTWDNVYSVWEEAFDSIDMTNKISWDSKSIPPVQNMSLKVPKELNNKEFVEFICSKLINDPHLLNTANIQNLIKELASGLIAKNGSISSITRQYAVDILESLLNNKIMCEQMRQNPDSIKKEDFIL